MTSGLLRPALTAFRDFLEQEYLPAARDELGLGALSGGADCYADVVEVWTTLRMRPAEIEALGRRHPARLERELVRLGAPRYGASAPEILERLRGGGFEDGVDSREDVVAHAAAAIERARRAMPQWFATPGETPIVVEPMARNLESSFPARTWSTRAGTMSGACSPRRSPSTR